MKEWAVALVDWWCQWQHGAEVSIEKYFPLPPSWRDSPHWERHSHYRGFIITSRHTTLVRITLDEWAAIHSDLYLTIHNTYSWQTFLPPGGIRTRSPSNRTAAEPRLRRRGHWHRPVLLHLPQILLSLAWDWNRPPAVRSRLLVTWCMTQSDAVSLLRLKRGRWKN
jgi:hypothetical protein